MGIPPAPNSQINENVLNQLLLFIFYAPRNPQLNQTFISLLEVQFAIPINRIEPLAAFSRPPSLQDLSNSLARLVPVA